MEPFILPLQIRWADIDSNVHVRHSVYYDWATMCRLIFLEKYGLTAAMMQRLQFGPVIFREECVFRKEIKHGDEVAINLKLVKGRRDYSRWTIVHEIKKNEDTLCAIVSIDGAWMNVAERKLFIPPAEVTQVFQQMPLDESFQWLD
ncbi:MAG TPA: acyl-CoA thioesterase [Chitinophagaceae bacterium]|nr:acyl-CoA thioesterase [Chitinophagaceae bacterium]